MKRIYNGLYTLLIFVTMSITARSQAAGLQLCPVPLDIPPRPVVEETLQAGESYVTADQADLVEGGISHLEGNVEITRDSQQTRADIVDYDQATETADLQGDVNFWGNEIYLHSDTAHLDLAEDSGIFINADYRIIANRGRGKADELFVITDKLTRGKVIDFTTCDPQGDSRDLTTNVWKISARQLTLDHETNRGSAKHAVLRIKDIPVFYTPYMTFPLSDKRKSGFLAPGYGTSNRNGFEIRTPYYWNIAPHMDATFTPRLITDSGLMLMGEYRYLFPRGRGNINVDYLPSDSQFNDENRSLIALEHSQSFAGSGNLYLLFNNVSDEHYFEDFGSTQTTSSTRLLERRFDIGYSGNNINLNWNIFARVQDFQIVDGSFAATSKPYKRLPQILFNAASAQRNNRINYGVNSEVVYFDRSEDPLPANVNGLRFDISPYLTYPMQTPATYLRPKIGLRYTQYNLEINDTFSDDFPNRIIPYISMDSGVFLERDLSLFNRDYMQTLEPRLYYLYVPKQDQSDLPIFDTGVYNFSYNSMFYENRFSGADRMNDANQVALSVTSRLFRSDGSEAGYIIIGQTFYLSNREVNLPGQITQEDAFSPVVAEFGATLSNHLSLRGDLQYDPNENMTRKLVIQAQYRPSEQKVINLAYRVRHRDIGANLNTFTEIEQTDVSFHWPVMGEWSVVGRWNYAIQEGKSLDLFGGVAYESCCWGMRLVGRRFLSNLDGDFQTGFFLQFELKGLAGSGRKTVDFLTQSIPGYISEF